MARRIRAADQKRPRQSDRVLPLCFLSSLLSCTYHRSPSKSWTNRNRCTEKQSRRPRMDHLAHPGRHSSWSHRSHMRRRLKSHLQWHTIQRGRQQLFRCRYCCRTGKNRTHQLALLRRDHSSASHPPRPSQQYPNLRTGLRFHRRRREGWRSTWSDLVKSGRCTMEPQKRAQSQ